MQRPYISGPMSGYEAHNFPAFFDAEMHLRKELKLHPLNPASSQGGRAGNYFETWEMALAHTIKEPKPWETYIHKDTQMLLWADSICMLPGWSASKGACLELIVAVNMGYPVMLYPVPDAIDDNAKEQAYLVALKHMRECKLEGVLEAPELSA